MARKRTRGRRWQAIRARQLRDHPLCAHCLPGTIRQAVEVDHIRRVSDGGSDDESNLQSLCAACHVRKSIAERGDRQRQGADSSGWPADPGHHWNVGKPHK